MSTLAQLLTEAEVYDPEYGGGLCNHLPMALTAEAFVEHRLHGVTLSKSAWSTIKRMLAGENVTQEASGLGKREWNELQALLKE